MTIRLAICADFAEERWPSMDRVARTLDHELQRMHRATIDATMVCPRFVRVATRLPLAGRTRVASSADRFLNRFWTYPRVLERVRGDYDLFHIIDHSYAHLAHALPAARTIVTCHDLDAFRSLLHPGKERRSGPFRTMTSDILTGLQRAARVTCDTAAIRDELVARGLVREDRLVVAPLGVSHLFSGAPAPEADRRAERLVRSGPGALEILHVGNTASRKRIDVLLRVCGAVREAFPELRVIRVGAPLTSEQERVMHDVGLADRLVAVNDVDEDTLAALYRRAALVLQPSDREGFGFPVLEALASATPVVASDLPVLREIGGAAAEYCPPGDIGAWVRTVAGLLRERCDEPDRWQARRDRARQQAQRFTWPRFASALVAIYRDVAERAGTQPAPTRSDTVKEQRCPNT